MAEPPAGLSGRISSRVRATGALAVAAAAILAVQAPVLGHYFFGDDFVPLADIASRSAPGYLRDLLLLRDETPNWRVLTGLFYLGAYRAFGLEAVPYLLASVLLHAGTAGLIFRLMRRATGAIWPALLAALAFGLTPASAPTVGQVTAINNVLGGFLLMLSVVLVDEASGRRRSAFWTAGAALAFAGAVAANESVAVLAPVPALIGAWRSLGESDGPAGGKRRARAVAAGAPFALIGGAALIGFGACRCTEAADGGLFGAGSHMFDNLWIYLGRLLYPVGMEPLGDVGAAHLVAGAALGALCAIALARGGTFARVVVAFLALALLPFLPLKLWSAPRYVYLATIPFAMLVGLYAGEIASVGRRYSRLVPATAAALAIGVLGLYGWQTWSQNNEFNALTRPWEELVAELMAAYPSLPAGSSVYVRGGPLTDPLLQCAVLPAVGETVWGDVQLFTLPDDVGREYQARPGYDVFVAEAGEGGLEPVELQLASGGDGGTVLLPHVPPDAEGNLCRDDLPGFP